MNRYDKYFELAKRLSRKSNHHRYHHGCIIVNKNLIVGFGYNQLKSHPKSPNQFKQIHAEFHAILGVSPDDLFGSIVFLYRENKNGKIGMSKPCPDCNKLLFQSGIRKVYYTNDKGEIENYEF